MASEKYKVVFGGNPDNEILLGTLEKGSSTIKGKEQKTKFRKGNCVFPNRTEGYGRRLLQKKVGDKMTYVPSDERVDASHKDYTGKIEWLPWGDPNGYPIEARYKSGASSLDYQYQVSRLSMKKHEDDLEDNYLTYPSGYQEFDVKQDSLKVEFLKIYFLNEDSVSKNPENVSNFFMFKEVREFNTQEFKAKEVDMVWDAVSVVKEATSFEKLKVIQKIMARAKEIIYDTSKENSLYDALILYASEQPKMFLNCIEQYKAEVSKLIELGKAYTAFDCTLNGSIWMTLPEKNLLIEDVDAKGDDMLQWLYDSCLEPRVFEAIEKLNLYSQKFKQ